MATNCVIGSLPPDARRKLRKAGQPRWFPPMLATLVDEPFSRDYVLRGQDEAAVRTLFTQALRSELASQQGQHLAGGGRVLFWWRNGSLPGPDGCNDFLSAGDRIRQLFFAG